MCVNDLSSARRQAFFFFALRLGYTTQLPWLLFILGHREIQKARAGIVRAFQLFEHWVQNGGRKLHWFAVLMLWPGSMGFHALQGFIHSTADVLDGGDGPTGPLTRFLKRIAARCRFAFSSDRLVESLHAYNKHYLVSAPNAKAVHVAFFAVGKAIRKTLEDSPRDIVSFADNCNAV